MSETDTARLPADTRIGDVRLRVADLERALRFYAGVLGYQVTRVDGASGPGAALSAGVDEPPQVLLVERPGARPKPWRVAGLFHAAIRLPTRRELARALHRLGERDWPIDGMSDHGVSEAVYLRDPDGNGLEIYADRPRERWPWRDGELAMVSDPLDLEGLDAEIAGDTTPWTAIPPGTDIGHVHLQVSSLRQAEWFYREVLGFTVMQRSYPGALFVAAGGYHHHLGLNVWAGEGIPPMSEKLAGLIGFSILLPNPDSLEAAVHRATAAGLEVAGGPAGGDHEAVIRDPDGNRVHLRAG